MKGNMKNVNRGLDCDVIVAEVNKSGVFKEHVNLHCYIWTIIMHLGQPQLGFANWSPGLVESG